jgi:hypothetical protein
VRVAAPVGALVVQPDDERHGLEARNPGDHLGAPLRVQPDQVELVGREPPRLRQQVLREAQLAHVVEQGAELDLEQLGAREPQPCAHCGRGGGDLQRMGVGGAVGLGERLHERVDLRLGVARRELAARMMRESLAGKDAQLPEQLHLTRFELSLLVPAPDADRAAHGGPSDHGHGGDGADGGPAHAEADQVRVDARTRHRDELLRLARTADHDPGLAEAEHGARMLREPVEHDTRIARLLGRRHPCR